MSAGALSDIILDDRADFASTDAAMGSMGVSEQERLQIYTLVAGVLHLGTCYPLPTDPIHTVHYPPHPTHTCRPLLSVHV